MIQLSEKPNDIYGKVMSFPDNAILQGFELLTNKDLDELKKYERLLKDSKTNPMDLKKELAYTITKELSSEQEARQAQQYFENVYQKKDLETNLEERILEKKDVNIVDLLYTLKIADSKGQARRLVQQSAISVDGEKIVDTKHVLEIDKPVVLRAGKKVIKIIKKG